MYKELIEKNSIFTAIILYLILFGLIQLLKPAFLYDNDGSLRDFGIGYRNKTILPIWLLAIILGILCYIIVLFYTTNKF